MSLSTPHRGRALATCAAVVLALGSAAGLAGQLVAGSTSSRSPADPSRPVSPAEASRLAAMRLHNYTDGRAGIRGSLGRGSGQIRLAGWVDWQRPLAYLSVTGVAPDPRDGLLQAVPGTAAVRPGRLAGSGTPAKPITGTANAAPPSATPDPVSVAAAVMPPAEPPPGRWRVRPFGVPGSPGSELDEALTLLFTVAAAQPDALEPLQARARWLRADLIEKVPVDVLLAPAVPPQQATSTPTRPAPSVGPASPDPAGPSGHDVRYWVDVDGRLLRLEAPIGASRTPLRIDVLRADRHPVVATDLLGGAPVAPRRVTAQEAATLARLRQRDRAKGGGSVEVELPGPGLGLITAHGWLDWRTGVAYVAVQDPGLGRDELLIRADPQGVSAMPAKERTPDGRPPLPVPGGVWVRVPWEARTDPFGATDLDLLLREALDLGDGSRADETALAGTAVWLRADSLDGVTVAVYELPGADERGRPPGAARLRYWVDDSGVLRRLEVRARVGGFGRLDVATGSTIPNLGSARGAVNR